MLFKSDRAVAKSFLVAKDLLRKSHIKAKVRMDLKGLPRFAFLTFASPLLSSLTSPSQGFKIGWIYFIAESSQWLAWLQSADG